AACCLTDSQRNFTVPRTPASATNDANAKANLGGFRNRFKYRRDATQAPSPDTRRHANNSEAPPAFSIACRFDGASSNNSSLPFPRLTTAAASAIPSHSVYLIQ